MGMSIDEILSNLKKELALDDIQWIPLAAPLRLQEYDDWLARGLHGEMKYLERHRDLKADPTRLLSDSRSVIMVSKSYVPNERPHDRLKGLRIAAYAQATDYHLWFKDLLEACKLKLEKLFPSHSFRCGTDSLPFLERDFAVQAALGWWGKNTCVIHPRRGSFFFLGEILSSVERAAVCGGAEATCGVGTDLVQGLAPLPDFCGHCDRCLQICPTGALEKPRQLNPLKCIAYWTIEAREVAPVGLREKFGDWFFGCDLCQTVCPWNQKPLRGSAATGVKTDLATEEILPSVDEAELRQDLVFLLTASDQEIRALVRGTPLERSKPQGLRRNAMIVLAHRQLRDLKGLLTRWREDAGLAELAEWAEAKLD
ncbi:MAG: tRNA epoxyqueuosine(34) reductase QueG [Bdellovibrio sp.]|nr:MAG: tRNA epoxyqueuosine(34) reductase QueG [Bdellovibrio sp.]